MLFPLPGTLPFPLAKPYSQLWASASMSAHSTGGEEGFPGSPILCLLWAPSATTILFLEALLRNLLFVHLFLHLPHDTELPEGRNHVMIITEPLAPHTACHTVLNTY